MAPRVAFKRRERSSFRLATRLLVADRQRFDREVHKRGISMGEAIRRAVQGWSIEMLEPPVLMLEDWDRPVGVQRIQVMGAVPFNLGMRFWLALNRAGMKSAQEGLEAAILSWIWRCEHGLE